MGKHAFWKATPPKEGPRRSPRGSRIPTISGAARLALAFERDEPLPHRGEVRPDEPCSHRMSCERGEVQLARPTPLVRVAQSRRAHGLVVAEADDVGLEVWWNVRFQCHNVPSLAPPGRNRRSRAKACGPE